MGGWVGVCGEGEGWGDRWRTWWERAVREVGVVREGRWRLDNNLTLHLKVALFRLLLFVYLCIPHGAYVGVVKLPYKEGERGA